MKITLIGHSTVLIEEGNTRVLTDPYHSAHGNLAYKRVRPALADGCCLTAVDAVLLSHAHWDHADPDFLRSLSPRTPILTARSTWLWARLRGVATPIAMRRWETRRIGDLEVVAVPASHVAPSIGFVVTGSRSVYFAGDTYYGAFMERLGQQFQLAAALLPATTFRIPMTMGTSGALRAVRALRPDVVIPIHLGIQPRLPLLRASKGVEAFAAALSRSGLNASFIQLREGESYSVPSFPEIVPGHVI